MRAGEADPADAVDLTDRLEQVAEERPARSRLERRRTARRRAALRRARDPARSAEREVPAVGVDVLAEQRDLEGARRAPAPRPRSTSSRERSALLGAADLGDDAVGARVVAADLDRHPRRVGVVDVHRRSRRRTRPRARPAPRGSRRSAGCSSRACSSSADRARDVVRAEHDVDVGRTVEDRLAVFLRETSRRPRSASRAAAPGATSGARACRRGGCRRSRGCSRC